MYDKELMLIADDLDLNRAILMEMFKDSFDVIEAENGQECMDMVEKYGLRLKIVLLDIHMPVMDGLQVLKKRNEHPVFADIPVVVITVNDEVSSQTEAFQLGATDYITKPFIRETVLHRINSILSSRRRLEDMVRSKKQLQIQAEIDQMTGIYNKVTAERLIGEQLANNHSINALLVIDIDDFKQVNDRNGHLVGDHTIHLIANLIANNFRKMDIVGRIGGDEFVVYMVDLPSRDLARKKTAQLVKLLCCKPNITHPADVSVSIGAAITEPRPYTYEELFTNADKALYFAKRNGKGQYAEYGVAGTGALTEATNAVALLFSKNSDTYSIINMLAGDMLLIEVISSEEALCSRKKYDKSIRLIYIDIASEPDSGLRLLSSFQKLEHLKDIPFIALCEEGNMPQYAAAINAGAVDIIPAPIDVSFARRRTTSFLNEQRHSKE